MASGRKARQVRVRRAERDVEMHVHVYGHEACPPRDSPPVLAALQDRAGVQGREARHRRSPLSLLDDVHGPSRTESEDAVSAPQERTLPQRGQTQAARLPLLPPGGRHRTGPHDGDWNRRPVVLLVELLLVAAHDEHLARPVGVGRPACPQEVVPRITRERLRTARLGEINHQKDRRWTIGTSRLNILRQT